MDDTDGILSPAPCTTPQRTQTMQNRESQILAKARRSVIETLYVRCIEGRGK